MAKFTVTVEVEFNPTLYKDSTRKIKAPRRWRVFGESWIREKWANGVQSVRIISMSDPILTHEEELGMEPDWLLKNHDLA